MNRDIESLDSQGRRHGIYKLHWFNGMTWIKTSYVHGKLHGPWERYYLNGELFSRGQFIKGNSYGLFETLSKKAYCMTRNITLM